MEVNKIDLEYLLEVVTNPCHNPLETGFRHHPLTKDEIIERLQDACDTVKQVLERELSE